MKKVLIVKTSSLGDIIHTLPALTDAARCYPNIQFDWVVEESFAEIPTWHPQVHQVIPVAWRRWRKNLLAAWQQKQLQQFYKKLRETQYDMVIDAQGLVKSALIARIAKGLHCGLDYRSARESVASLFYKQRCVASWKEHAVTRIRQLLATTLHYPYSAENPDYGIRAHFDFEQRTIGKNILLIHGTTVAAKEWPEKNWCDLAKRLAMNGWHVQIPWGSTTEKSRAEKIAEADARVQVLPKTSLHELAMLLLQAKAAIAVDTGIGHLAAALDVPTISLYGPTNPVEIGTRGHHQTHLRKSNQMGDISVDDVLAALKE